MELNKVNSSEINVGDPLLWDVIDKSGKLLLKKGAVVTSSRLQEILIERGLYQPLQGSSAITAEEQPKEAPRGPFNPFEIIESCTFRLGRALYNLTQLKDCSENLNKIAADLIMACEKAPDAALGAVHLLHGHAYTTIHPIHVAALAHALCKATKASAEETQSVVLASLVANIGMLELQEVLHEQVEPLSQEQKDQINAHPKRSVKILQASGISDRKAQLIVFQHHERANGEGYPQKITADKICRGAKILALADCYSAMISPRNYRDTMDAAAAMKTLFLERGKEYDETLAVMLIKYMGIYPPGTYVKLKNDEVGIVVKRTSNNMAPLVSSVISIKQLPYSRPIPRPNDQEEFAITGMVENTKKFTFSLASIWGYQSL